MPDGVLFYSYMCQRVSLKTKHFHSSPNPITTSDTINNFLPLSNPGQTAHECSCRAGLFEVESEKTDASNAAVKPPKPLYRSWVPPPLFLGMLTSFRSSRHCPGESQPSRTCPLALLASVGTTDLLVPVFCKWKVEAWAVSAVIFWGRIHYN